MKVRELLNEGIEKLKSAGVPDAAYDARELLKKAYGYETAELLDNLDRDLCPGAMGGTEPAEITYCPGDCSALSAFQQDINKRAKRVPLQHILGHAGFMGLDFKVNADVLIPRADTEILVETVLSNEKDKDISVLDLCTGSGCIAAALKRLGGYRLVTASDKSRRALDTAKENASINKADIDFMESDLFDKIDESFDAIVSNPPYIESNVIDTLEPEVRDYDPRMALDGGEDGLSFYRRIIDGTAENAGCGRPGQAAGTDAASGKKVLKPHGRLYLEVGFNQADIVAALMKDNGFTDIHTVKDLAGLNRVVYGKRSF